MRCAIRCIGTLRWTALLSLVCVTYGSGCCMIGHCVNEQPIGIPSVADAGCAGDCAGDCAGGCADCGGAYQATDLYPGTCGNCVRGGGGGLSGVVLPLLSSRLACRAGCGPLYLNEWMFDPPECCDPCQDGCWVGPQTCEHPGLLRATWWGVTGAVRSVLHTGFYGYGSTQVAGCGDPHCTSCIGDAVNPIYEEVPEGEIIMEEGESYEMMEADEVSMQQLETNRPSSEALSNHVQSPLDVATKLHRQPSVGTGAFRPPHRLVTKRMLQPR